MNPLKCVAYAAVITFDEVKFKINHFFKQKEFQRAIAEEQARRWNDYNEFCKLYLECVEKSKLEE